MCQGGGSENSDICLLLVIYLPLIMNISVKFYIKKMFMQDHNQSDLEEKMLKFQSDHIAIKSRTVDHSTVQI